MKFRRLAVLAAVLAGLVTMLFVLALLGYLSPGQATAALAAPDAEHTVCPASPPTCDFGVIQDAVDAAAAGDTILAKVQKKNTPYSRAHKDLIARGPGRSGGGPRATVGEPGPAAAGAG